jgi:hypothetical protein
MRGDCNSWFIEVHLLSQGAWSIVEGVFSHAFPLSRRIPLAQRYRFAPPSGSALSSLKKIFGNDLRHQAQIIVCDRSHLLGKKIHNYCIIF